MKACARFDEEGILAVEAGKELDTHFDDCPDCRQARAEHGRLTAAIAELAVDERPPGDWQARVWSRVRRAQAARRRRWRLWALVPVGLTAALVGAVLLTPRTAATPELVARVEPGGGPARRGTEAHPGDLLVLAAHTGGLAHAELRVYLNDRELVLRCAGEPPCARRGDRLTARFTLNAIGSYQPVFLASDQPLPAPGAGLDADAGAALAAGVAVELPKRIEVR